MILDRPRFFDAIRHRFGKLTQPQVDGYERLLAGIEGDDMPTAHVAYLLATVRHETAETMEPIIERGSRDYIASRYDPVLANSQFRRANARRMGNTEEGDGWKYRGRGYVQLTWKSNYRRLGDLLDIDLVAQPDLALDPDTAYAILSVGMRQGLFTGAKLDDYLTPRQTDYIGARRIVNGIDCATQIAAYAVLYEKSLRAATP